MKEVIKERMKKIREGIVPEGYKKTRVGIFPEDWKIKTLEDVTIADGIVRGPFGGALRKDMFVEEGYKVYQQGNAIRKDIDFGTYFIDKQKYEELKRFRVKKDDFIVSCSGTIGEVFRIPLNYEEGVINQALLKITIDLDCIDDNFFHSVFESPRFQSYITENTQGGAMKNLVGMKVFRKTNIQLPPINEQQKIADVLSTWDWAIELKESHIKEKEEQKKGLMESILSPKKHWEKKSLGKLVDRTKGKPVKTREDGQHKVLNIQYLNSRADPEYTNEKPVYAEEKDILLLWDGANAGSIYTGFKGVVGSTFMRLSPKGVNSIFIREYMRKDEVYIKSLREGSGIPHVPRDFLSYYKIFIPPLEEQDHIANILSTADEEIELLKQELEQLKQQKKGLMQLLLTGIVRINGM